MRDIDPSWRPRPGLYESAEGAISHQIATEAEANARFNELRRDAIPGTSHDWGVNRLRKELYDRGYFFDRPTRSPGAIYFNPQTKEEVRIMERPQRKYRTESNQKHLNDYYYRYRPSNAVKPGSHITIPNKSKRGD